MAFSDINLNSLNGSNGFAIKGIASNDASGNSVSHIGDINGDGFGDLVVGAPGANANDSGQSYVVLGSSQGFRGSINLASLNPERGFALNGINANDGLGASVSGAGDVNGDGIDDLIIGAPNADPHELNSGQSYVVFGSRTGFSLELSNLNGSNGFSINGINAGDHSGSSVSSAGDVNGDGIDDLIIGAPNADPHEPNSGQSYVVFGSSSGFNSSLNLSRLNGSNGFILNGIKNPSGYSGADYSGSSVSSAGDVNGDGIDDLIIGAPLADPNRQNSGQSYVVFGSSTGFNRTLELSSLNGSNGFILNGIKLGDHSGNSVSNAGDINGDGIDDLIIGAPQGGKNRWGYVEGQSYVVFGSTGGFSSSLELSSLSRLGGSQGFIIKGVWGDRLGTSVSGAGDVNGDGIDDLIIGAIGRGYYSGGAFVIFGSSSGSFARSPSELNGSNGFAIGGKGQYDFMGASVSSAGDVNGDGIDDLLMGAPGAGSQGFPRVNGPGESYVVFGSIDGLTLTRPLADATDLVRGGIHVNLAREFLIVPNPDFTVRVRGYRNVIGSTFDDTLVGNDANNSLEGGIGHDLLSGGAGNDTLSGGSGIDTLTEMGEVNFILTDTSLTGNGTDTLIDIEQVNLSGRAGNNVLDASAFTLGSVTLKGGSGNDTLLGGSGNDSLQGGSGEDSLVGTQGNDTYEVDTAGDVVLELASQGTDWVTSSVNYVLGSNVENLTLTGLANLNGTGNALNNEMVGNSGSNSLNGSGGDDSLNGGAGDDTLLGGLGNDSFTVGSIGDVVIENANQGIDLVSASFSYTLKSNLENLTLLGTAHINGTGNTFNNLITGNSGNNSLNGGGGNDTLVGGTGNDRYGVNASGDVIIENANEGIDGVSSSVNYVLGSNVENLTLTGLANLNGTGNALNNEIIGNSGSNSLNGGGGDDNLKGGSGNDTLLGGFGNDSFTVGSIGDVVIENANQGIDLVSASFSYTLGSNLENLTLLGTAHINGTGNSLNNLITGNLGNNSLNGGSGHDSLLGGDGNDTLTGELGHDSLTGGSGVDQFVFNTNTDFSNAIGVDILADFVHNSDKIVLDKTTFTALTSLAGNGFSIGSEFAIVLSDAAAAISSASIVYNSSNGSLFYNPNGSAAGFGAGAHFSDLIGNPTLSGSDFVVQA